MKSKAHHLKARGLRHKVTNAILDLDNRNKEDAIYMTPSLPSWPQILFYNYQRWIYPERNPDTNPQSQVSASNAVYCYAMWLFNSESSNLYDKGM